jgi:hypothetical protein
MVYKKGYFIKKYKTYNVQCFYHQFTGGLMSRKALRTIWIIGTMFLLGYISNVGQQNPEVSNATLGVVSLLVIFVSVIVYKAVAGSKGNTQTRFGQSKYPTIDDYDINNRSIAKPIVAPQPIIVRETYEQYKGRLGEDRVVSALKPLPYNNRILRNLLITDEAGSSTEIDLVVITSMGVYVIESKNYSGWIFGNHDQQHWTQVFANQTKNKFYNPIHQNVGHIKALKKKLQKYTDIDYYSVIVFSDEATLKNVPRSDAKTMILNIKELCEIIKSSIEFNNKLARGPLLISTKIDELWSELYQYTINTAEERSAHIKSVSDLVKAKQEA